MSKVVLLLVVNQIFPRENVEHKYHKVSCMCRICLRRCVCICYVPV